MSKLDANPFVRVRDLSEGERFAADGHLWKVTYVGEGRIEARESPFGPIRNYYDPVTAAKAGVHSWEQEVSRLGSLRARLEWEAEHPRPETLVRAERAIVRALDANGFGRQYQVTRENGFEIAVDDLFIRVEIPPKEEQ